MRILSIVALALSGLLVSAKSLAIEPLDAEQLQEVCANAEAEPDSAETRLCVFYVKGFLDGAVATDGRVAQNVVSEMDDEETFTERAIRTRVINRLRDYGPSVYAEFCVGQPDPIVDVMMHVIDELDRYDDLDGKKAQTIVDDALRRHYPCTAKGSPD